MIRDFTVKAVGTKCEDAVIQQCPKCGRNGKYEPHRFKKTPERNYDSWTHKAELDNICGMGMDCILEHCTQKGGV